MSANRSFKPKPLACENLQNNGNLEEVAEEDDVGNEEVEEEDVEEGGRMIKCC